MGIDSTMETQCAAEMLEKFEIFRSKWYHEISSIATITALNNIKNYIGKGCCSNIQEGAETNRNERLHKLLKKSLLGSSTIISPELAIAVLSVVLYIWNTI